MLAFISGLNYNSTKNSALTDLIKLPKDDNECTHLLVQAMSYKINKGLIADSKRGPIQNTTFADDNLIVDS